MFGPSATIVPSGGGTASSPVVFDLVPGAVVTEIVERDTDTIDMHVTELSPGVVEVAADALLSDDDNNALGYGTDGKLMVHAGSPVLPPILWKTRQGTAQTLQPGQPQPLAFDTAVGPGSPTGTTFTAPRTGWYDLDAFMQMDNPGGGISALVLYMGAPGSSDERYSGTGVAQFPSTIGGPGTQCSDKVRLSQGQEFVLWAAQYSTGSYDTHPERTMFALNWLHE